MTLSNSDIPLGSEVKDIVTKFTGIVTGKVVFLTKCTQYIVSPGVDVEKDPKKLPDSHTFDEERLVVIGPGVSADFAAKLASPIPPTGSELIRLTEHSVVSEFVKDYFPERL